MNKLACACDTVLWYGTVYKWIAALSQEPAVYTSISDIKIIEESPFLEKGFCVSAKELNRNKIMDKKQIHQYCCVQQICWWSSNNKILSVA